MASQIKNVFNEIPELDKIKDDINKFLKYKESRDNKNKPQFFNTRGLANFPKTKVSSPIRVELKIIGDNINVTVTAKLDKNSPEYKGTQSVRLNKFIDSDFKYNDFTRVLARCIENFDSEKEIDNMDKLFKKAGTNEEEFLEQIYVSTPIQKYIKDGNDLSRKQSDKIVNEMIHSSKYGLEYFKSMLSHPDKPDGFDYDEIALDVLKNV